MLSDAAAPELLVTFDTQRAHLIARMSSAYCAFFQNSHTPSPAAVEARGWKCACNACKDDAGTRMSSCCERTAAIKASDGDKRPLRKRHDAPDVERSKFRAMGIYSAHRLVGELVTSLDIQRLHLGAVIRDLGHRQVCELVTVPESWHETQLRR